MYNDCSCTEETYGENSWIPGKERKNDTSTYPSSVRLSCVTPCVRVTQDNRTEDGYVLVSENVIQEINKRVVCRWKQWWFVLEGRLLLYYKSQLEYINLSPCRGSLNMGLASSVRPGKGLELQVVTRSQTVILRAANRTDHEQWLQAMLDAMMVQGSTNTFSSYPVLHFRYSNDSNDVPFNRQDSLVNRIKHFGGRSYTLPVTSNQSDPTNIGVESNNNHGMDDRKNMANTESEEHLLKKKMSQSNERLSETKANHLDRNHVHNSLRRSKIGLSDTFIPERIEKENRLSDLSEQTSLSLNDLRKSFSSCSNKDISKHDYIEIDYGGFDKENEYNPGKENSKKINSKHKHELEVSSKHEEQNHKTVAEVLVGASVQTLKDPSEGISFSRNNTYQSVKKHVNKIEHQDKKIPNPSSLYKNKYYFGLCQSKDVRSDTDLSVKKMSRPLSGSCGEIQKINVYSESKLVEPAINSTLVYDKKQILTDTHKQNISRVSTQILGSKSRSNSLLCKPKECKAETEKGLERRGTLKKRSLSFLQKVWRKKEKKQQEEQDYETVAYETIPNVIDMPPPPPPPPNPKIEPKKPSPIGIRVTDDHQNENAPDEPSPDYDTSFTEEIEKPPELPPRQKERPPSPWHDIPKNNAPIIPPEDEVPPALPAKTINRSLARRCDDDDDNMYMLKHHHEWTLKQDHTLCFQSETTVKVNDVKKLTDIDMLLAELSEVNFLATNELSKPCTWKNTCSVMANNMEDRKYPDYDVPRPHASLLTTLRSQNLQSEAIPPTNFFCNVPHNERDSVGTTISRFSSEIDLEFTPDSLECNVPLSMSGQVDSADFIWIPPTLHTTSTIGALQRHHYLFGDDRQYEDSLNT